MSVTNEQLLTAIQGLTKTLALDVTDNKSRLLVIERAGVPTNCGDHEIRIRRVEVRSLLWEGKYLVLGGLMMVLLCGCASSIGTWLFLRNP